MDPERRLVAFDEAIGFALQVIEDPAAAERWSEPSALDGMTVGGVAGHLYAALRRLEVVLDEPVPDAGIVVGLEEFYGANRIDDPSEIDEGLHRGLREDAERRASFGPEAVTERFVSLVARLRERVPTETMDRPVPVWNVANGTTPLSDYLVTRVIEAVVHADDLAASVGIDREMPPTAAAVVIGACMELARARNGDLAVIRALTRSERADAGTLRVL